MYILVVCHATILSCWQPSSPAEQNSATAFAASSLMTQGALVKEFNLVLLCPKQPQNRCLGETRLECNVPHSTDKTKDSGCRRT